MMLEEKLYRENIQLASIWSRAFAFLLDKFLISILFSVIYWNDFSKSAGDYAVLVQLVSNVMGQFLILSITYEILFVMLYGATLGKLVFKIKIISISLLDHPSFFSAFIRSTLKIVGEFIFYASYFVCFFSPFRQTLHDYLARTIVVKNA